MCVPMHFPVYVQEINVYGIDMRAVGATANVLS